MNFKPVLIYNFFQILAAGLWILMLHWGLPRRLGQKRIFVFSLVTLIAAPLGAQFFPAFFGYVESQSHYGALIGQMIAAWTLMRFVWKMPEAQKQKTWAVFSIASSFVYAILRVGCFFRGCCWGTLCPYPWAIVYRDEGVVTPAMHLPLHPVQLYSALHGLLMGGILYFLWKSGRVARRSPHWMLGIFLILLGAGRLLTDHFRADPNPNFILNIASLLVGTLLAF